MGVPKYLTTVRDNVLRLCPMCDRQTPIYVMVEDGIQTIGCCVCQRIHRSEAYINRASEAP